MNLKDVLQMKMKGYKTALHQLTDQRRMFLAQAAEVEASIARIHVLFQEIEEMEETDEQRSERRQAERGSAFDDAEIFGGTGV